MTGVQTCALPIYQVQKRITRRVNERNQNMSVIKHVPPYHMLVCPCRVFAPSLWSQRYLPPKSSSNLITSRHSRKVQTGLKTNPPYLPCTCRSNLSKFPHMCTNFEPRNCSGANLLQSVGRMYEQILTFSSSSVPCERVFHHQEKHRDCMVEWLSL